MKRELPLGRDEDQAIEFKTAGALEHPAGITRAAVSMLNASGGTVWVGIVENDERAVAAEPIQDVQVAVRRLHDHLIDSIEPSPTDEEVTLEAVPCDGGEVIAVDLRPSARNRPYAGIGRGGSRHYDTRVGARRRSMTREELRREYSGHQQVDSDGALERLDALQESEAPGRHGLFRLAMIPMTKVCVDCDSTEIVRCFEDPDVLQLRRMGWNCINYHQPSRSDRLSRTSTVLAEDDPGHRKTEVSADGLLLFRTTLARFHWKGNEDELYPFALLEFPCTFFRLARAVYSSESGLSPRLGPHDTIVADLQILGLERWRLRSGSPQTFEYSLRSPSALTSPEQDGSLSARIRFPLKDLCGNLEDLPRGPDRLAIRLVRRVYQAYEFGESAIPREYDARDGVLRIPE